ncbi:hypothetical protein [Pseudomonas putida]|uniref:Uncharacterized protein n=1 Tax=Pseudomonas putida TaxID=303 RepID=A0A7V8EJB6_PSEPU|nr:hypothetical protein [Pseudomonas putida]KAF0255908.1 hypothetical protein GN299_05380 [Pseudomonas putida]
MTDFELIFVILVCWAMGMQLGYALGFHRACNRLIPELNQEREAVARLKLLARMHGDHHG